MFLIVVLIIVAIASYCDSLGVSWSNRLGSTLTSYGKNIYAAERPFVWNSIDVGGRSIIIKLSDNTLFVHSPVDITPDLTSQLNSLGKVGHVVSPNYEHLKYARLWQDKYPTAKRYACPGLSERMTDADWYCELGKPSSPGKQPSSVGTSASTSAVMKDFEIIHIDCEVNPLTSKPFFNEILFYHKASKSLLVTDLFWNYPSSDLPNYVGVSNTGTYTTDQQQLAPLPAVKVPFGTKIWKFLMDVVYLPIYKLVLVGPRGLRRKRYRELMDYLLSLDIEMILPCHGDVIKGNALCKKVLEKFLA
jgi:hypothetical protein